MSGTSGTPSALPDSSRPDRPGWQLGRVGFEVSISSQVPLFLVSVLVSSFVVFADFFSQVSLIEK